MSTALTARRAAARASYPEAWEASDTYQVSPRVQVTRGQPLKIRGERGQFTFWDHVVNPPCGKRRKAIEWVTVCGPHPKVSQFRAFRPDRIGRVYPARPARSRRS
jgi:hypothetical protein